MSALRPALLPADLRLHQLHHNLTETAHDVGTGPGQVAAELSTHFGNVLGNDSNAIHLAVARQRLGSLVSSQQVHLVQCSAEGLADEHPPSSVDLISAADHGRPVFAEPEYASKCQPILESILDRSFAKFIKAGRPQHVFGWKRATDRMKSFLDDVELWSGMWQDVQRIKWISEHAMPFCGPDACDFEITRSSKIGPEEKVTEIKEPGFWERQWDLAGVKRFVLANLPFLMRKTRTT
ncbi:hypothetical protein MMC13_002051 [Lambiella insularis]|nr:hypothetical protein [Lambiella insularis]